MKSINVSGHKYGLVYPGIGWVVWRDRADLPEDLIFHISYLGGDEATFNLNFSKGASQVIAQYYNFLRLGREGYRRIMTNLRSTADYLAGRLAATGRFTLLGDRCSLPSVASRLTEPRPYTVYDISERLRATAGSSRRTTCRRTPRRSRCCASWSARTSAATWPTCSSTT